MKRTTITMDEYGRVAVPSDAASVWMSEMELVELFNVIVPTLRATVRSVYKSGVLKSCEVETRIRLPNGYYAEAYALPMVVALAFHINTPNAARVRNALLERMCLRNTHPYHYHISPKKCGFASSGFFFSPFDGWHCPFRCIFLFVGFFCAVLHSFTYQGFNRHAVALQPCLIRLPTGCRRH